ncbi:hypothetical protein PR048_002893 [Dryococelus australis]|uniref:PiggyBac transposable element-derived protein domain-containing protein n=1 Tax=Dryococelus australis TaxID=614101 RepID=A0ABQ9ILF1_9NEOP|nr:hypothetical protein PR048_002893 [Dryococelus australis]
MIFMWGTELAQIKVKDWEKQLKKGFENTGRIVYTDSFFSSPNLFSFLLESGIGGCGTVRCNRKSLPAEMKHLTLK